MTFDVARASTLPAEALCEAFNAAFANYVVTFPTLDVEAWRATVGRQGVDLALSLAACHDGRVMAFSLVTPRGGKITRIATMGARPEARGTGIAGALLDQALSDAQARGDAMAELEVFAQNERAFRLYRSRGFQVVCSLCGFEAQRAAGADVPVTEVSREDGAHWASAFERGDPTPLPWQVCGGAIACAPPGQRIWRHGEAQLTFMDGGGAVTVMSVLDRSAGYTNAARLLDALRCRFPDHAIRAPQLQREVGPAEAFERAGWTRSPLFQYLMRLPFSSSTG